jgi:hypothetical protein
MSQTPEDVRENSKSYAILLPVNVTHEDPGGSFPHGGSDLLAYEMYRG